MIQQCDLNIGHSAFFQALGWSILLCLIFMGAVARVTKPCFNHAVFLQTRYWSNYLDVEAKLFDETCVHHARDFARKCVVRFFEDIGEDEILRMPLSPNFSFKKGDNEADEDEHLHGVTRKDQVDHLLQTWFQCRPELDVTKMVYRPTKCITWEDSNGHTLYSDV